jgi:hypothetical protein
MNPQHGIITPVCDEEKYIEVTIETVRGRTTLPADWQIVVGDSTDRPCARIEGYAARSPWMRLALRVDRTFRKAGGDVIEASNYAYRLAELSN